MLENVRAANVLKYTNKKLLLFTTSEGFVLFEVSFFFYIRLHLTQKPENIESLRWRSQPWKAFLCFDDSQTKNHFNFAPK